MLDLGHKAWPCLEQKLCVVLIKADFNVLCFVFILTGLFAEANNCQS